MEDVDPDPHKRQETKELLNVVIDELKNIGLILARQDERIDALSKAKDRARPQDCDSVSVAESEALHLTDSISSNSTVSISSTISTELRTGFILQEGLTRYNLNAVPAWSPFYGTHLMQGEGPETAEDAIRNSEWTAVLGHCWRIPHDNRINFCFRTGMSGPESVSRVQKFLSDYHRPVPYLPKGDIFNVWDWFDTGLSAYWYPGMQASTTPLRFPHWLAGGSSKDSDQFPLSTMVAPWRRVINMQGLTSLTICDGSVNPQELRDDDLCPILSETKVSFFQEPMDEVLWRAVKCHLRCMRISESEHTALETKGWMLFHITFYEILQSQAGEELLELWPCGELHSDKYRKGRPRKIRESTLTIIATPSMELPGPKSRSIYWTILCMRPHHFPHLPYSESRDDLSRKRTHEMIDEMSDLVYGNLLIVIGRWEQIACYMEGLLAEKNGLLDPEYHDSLLTDDATFTRSKKYFWAIEFLIEAETSVLDNINQAKRFLEIMNSNPPSGEVARRMFLMRLRKHNTAIQKLEIIRKGFVKKKEEAKALRDGLFSASAVMESRASTQLGENIKILTYVSIFFLPITVCTSFWSMSDSLFSLSSLAIVTPLVALATYAIVLNLDRIIQIFIPLTPATPIPPTSLVRNFINRQIHRMQQDQSAIWKERGEAFEKSKLLGKSGRRPSRWRVLQFTIRGILLPFWNTSVIIFVFLLHLLLSCRKGRRQRMDDELMPTSSRNLGDVEVQVQVDVSVEKGWASIAASTL
ncbi:hypothetical protein N431DRAFT_399020 [Stipitochalara longipes BDJ]|nr:hypothetical protein N431DRAFT_399020 [Stipitochalara longipes BDJ]